MWKEENKSSLLELPDTFRAGLENTCIIQQGSSIFCFVENVNRINAYRLSGLDTGQYKEEKLPNLKSSARAFSVALFKDRLIHLSGGFDKASKQVAVYDIELKKWSSAPSMNHGRNRHASCCLGKNIYVFGGHNNHGSIEALSRPEKEAKREWKVIVTNNQLTRRHTAAVAVLNPTTIAVFGGKDSQFCNDGYKFDTEQKSVAGILGGSSDLKFCCLTPVR